jgi:hypothetical protein
MSQKRGYTVFSLRVILAALFTLSMAVDTSHGGVRTYATEEEVLNMAFPGADIEERTVRITPGMDNKIEDLIKGRFFKKSVSFYIARKDGETLGYATVTNEKGRKRNITFMVVLDGAGAVKSVDLLVFRESQGYQVENPAWREQFIGKTLKDPLRVKRDIRNISGATMSSRAVTKGVKKVLAVFQVVRTLLE